MVSSAKDKYVYMFKGKSEARKDVLKGLSKSS